jgi:hypothetical protein
MSQVFVETLSLDEDNCQKSKMLNGYTFFVFNIISERKYVGK